jgi:hypothetical protein
MLQYCATFDQTGWFCDPVTGAVVVTVFRADNGKASAPRDIRDLTPDCDAGHGVRAPGDQTVRVR